MEILKVASRSSPNSVAGTIAGALEQDGVVETHAMIGTGMPRLVFRHLIPNTMAPNYRRSHPGRSVAELPWFWRLTAYPKLGKILMGGKPYPTSNFRYTFWPGWMIFITVRRKQILLTRYVPTEEHLVTQRILQHSGGNYRLEHPWLVAGEEVLHLVWAEGYPDIWYLELPALQKPSKAGCLSS